MNKDVLRKLQLTQLDILKVIDKFCKDNNIEYSLYGGTLIGAVRHNGFIPWDDDLDIAMSRTQYNKFIKCWMDNPIHGYIFQDSNTDSKFPYTFGKIRKDKTAYICDELNSYSSHNGIFIDIFPLDKVPNNKLSRVKYFILGAFYLLYSRGYASKNDGKIIYMITNTILKVTPKKYRLKLKNKIFNQLNKYNCNENLSYVDTSLFRNLKLYFPKELFDVYEEIKFEDSKFPVFGIYKEYLKIEYGDYLKLPPEEERVCKHNPIKIVFEEV